MSVRRNRYGVRKKSGEKKSDYFLNIRMVFQSAESRIPKFWTHFFSPPKSGLQSGSQTPKGVGGEDILRSRQLEARKLLYSPKFSNIVSKFCERNFLSDNIRWGIWSTYHPKKQNNELLCTFLEETPSWDWGILGTRREEAPQNVIFFTLSYWTSYINWYTGSNPLLFNSSL